MGYPDEQRDPSVTEAQLRRAFLNDPMAWGRFRALQEQDVRQREEIADLEKQLRELKRSSQQSAKLHEEIRDLTRRLGSAHGALEAYRKDAARLKGDLKRLRASQSYRIGRALTAPTSVWRQLVRRAADSSPALTQTASPPSQTAICATPGPPADESPKSSASPTVSSRPLSEMSYQELTEWFDHDPHHASMSAVLSRAWYGQGLITAPAEMIRINSEIAAEFIGAEGILAERILGADRLLSVGPDVPRRAAGAAYQPERSRIMYCAHSTAAFNSNGYSIRTHGVASALLNAGQDVTVVARAGYPWDNKTDTPAPLSKERHEQRVDGVSYVHLPGSSLTHTPVDQYLIECADAFVREARLQRPSLIHAASNYQTALPALIAARRLGIPFVYEVRGLWEITEASDKLDWEKSERYAQQVELETRVAREADAVLAITEETRSELVRRGVPAELISLAPNAVDTETCLPLPPDTAFARAHRVRTDCPVIGFAGSIVAYEGLAVLLEAASRLASAEEVPDFQVVIAGSGPAEPGLRNTVAELGLQHHVRFLGRLPNAAMPRLMSLFDIVALPRLDLPVTQMVSPLKPLEALSSSKAVILSDVSPHHVFAGERQERARLVRAGDTDALADCLKNLIGDADSRANLGRAGRLWCIDERQWSHVAEMMAQAHRTARARHDRLAHSSTGENRPLKSLRVGLIADEFTTRTLTGVFDIQPLDRFGWSAQLDGLDLLFIESAWNGNGGQWHRAVGRYYSEEHDDLRSLIARARDMGIPTVFWNKEDPVHFQRFIATASMCDHVFTTDAGMIPDYLKAGVGSVRSAASLPFYAQPRLHNPLPGRLPFEESVAYAGTYYGDRYPVRSKELSDLLTAAEPYGLTIYDRQLAVTDSAYHFPPRFLPFVRGSLPYSDVIDSYKAHLANINVNSVENSPSMFSRRVVEIAASGGVVLSGSGRGVTETFGSAIPATGDRALWRALLHSWSTDPEARLREAWLQMRTVLRAHTVQTAMTLVARTAGLAVSGPRQPSYATIIRIGSPEAGEAIINSLLNQSVRPVQVLLKDGDTYRGRMIDNGLQVVEDESQFTADFIAMIDAPLSRTSIEDLLLAAQFGRWDFISAPDDSAPRLGDPLATPVSAPQGHRTMVAQSLVATAGSVEAAMAATDALGVRLLLPKPSPDTRPAAGRPTHQRPWREPRVLVAGHDLKFAHGLMDALSVGRLSVDAWTSHAEHDEDYSRRLLEGADVVFCEWALGNAVWYSKHLLPHQRLIVRVHSQELRRPYLRQINHERVHRYIFVGRLVMEAAIQSHGLPRDKCVVVPNGVDTQALALPKTEDAARTIGLVGIVPRSKRLDLALDLLAELEERGRRYTLRVKGRLPSDYPWMQSRPDELDYYTRAFERIEAMNARRPGAVILDPHGHDMAGWYRHIGVALSVSDFESFHLTIADGAASGALPVLMGWPGADLIYPRTWITPTIAAAADRIVTSPTNRQDKELISKHFEGDLVHGQIREMVLNAMQETPSR